MRRRDSITLVGGAAAAAWPPAAQAQQPAMPLIGFLYSQSPDGFAIRLRGFRQGLKEAGFVEGENVAVEYRWAENERPAAGVAAELVRRRVAVITAMAIPSTLEAKAATTTIPIVFIVGDDPVKLGLVASLARPGGNLTGVNFFTTELAAKRLAFLHELVPATVRVAVWSIRRMPISESVLRDVEAAARAIRLQVQVRNASSSGEIDAAFAAFVRERPTPLRRSRRSFNGRRVQLAQLAAH